MPKISNLPIAARSQRPHSVPTAPTQRYHSVSTASTQRYQSVPQRQRCSYGAQEISAACSQTQSAYGVAGFSTSRILATCPNLDAVGAL